MNDKIKNDAMRKLVFIAANFLIFSLNCTVSEGQKVDYIKIPELEKILKNPENRLFVVNFWATWCPPCVAGISNFEKAANNIVVPIAFTDNFVLRVLVRPGKRVPASEFVIKASPVLVVRHVGLIADDFVAVDSSVAAKLYAAVGVIADQPALETQFEITVGFLGA